jgi:hypothetical protein
MDENLTRCSTRADPTLPKTASNQVVERLLESQERNKEREKLKKKKHPPNPINLTTQEIAMTSEENQQK